MRFLADGQCFLEKWLGVSMPPGFLVKEGEVVQHRRRLELARPPCSLAEREGTLVKGLGLGELAKRPADFREIIESGRHVGVLGAQGRLEDGQGTTLARLGVGKATLVLVEHAQIAKRPAQIGPVRLRCASRKSLATQELGLGLVVVALGAAGKSHAVEHHGHAGVIRAQETRRIAAAFR